MNQQIQTLLDDIESRIDPEVEDDYNRQWEDFLMDKFTGDIFCPVRKKTKASNAEYKKICINDAIEDYDLMMLDQIQGVSNALNSASRPLNVRSNYGTGILSSPFGLRMHIMPYEMNTLPTTIPLNDTDKIREIVDKNSVDVNAGLGKKVYEMGEYFKDAFSKYPKIVKYVDIYHPDIQGPLDVCELIWGSQIFYDLYDNPDLVHSLLKIVCDVYIRFLDKWFALVGAPGEINSHWETKFKGAIMLRDDSAMNLSPEMYEEFGFTYDNLLLERFNGGAVHFCGRGDHYIDILCRAEKLTGINMSQPHLNNMETIYRATVESGKKIKLLWFDRPRAEKDKSRLGAFSHNMHSVINSNPQALVRESAVRDNRQKSTTSP
jgi:hypothetical protein